jgi:putative component of toxin-antitoxin plasmid stabilization module
MRAVVIALLLVLARPAWAEDIAAYPVEGDSDPGATDPRVAALDEAFSRAVTAALSDVLDAATRKAHKQVLDKEILARARLWIAGFKVDKEELVDGRKQLSVTVRVDRDKMRARLEQLDIGAAPDPTAAVRTGVVLLRVTEGTAARASFGSTAEKDLPGLAALSSTLRASGITLKKAPATGTAARATGDLPLDDDDAEGLATELKAELAVVAGVTVGPITPIRGVATNASLITAHVRVIARGKKLVGQGVAAVASRGSETSAISAAIERAVVAAAGDAMPSSQAIDKPTGFTGDDTPLAEPGVVLIRIPAKTPYALVAAELKYLAGAKGISRASLHRVSPGGWVIGVATAESVQKVASIARKAPAADISAQVKVVGDLVELTLSGSR